LLATAVVFDIIYLIWGNRDMASVAYWMMAAGIVGGLIAAPFGLIDWLAIPSGTRAKTIGLLHGVSNLVAILLFAWELVAQTLCSRSSGNDGESAVVYRCGYGRPRRMAWWRAS
jgi:uncharacterized membrane protein